MSIQISAEDRDLLFRAFQQSSQPLTAKKLWDGIGKVSRFKESELHGVLNDLAKEGSLKTHRAQRSVFWLPALEEEAKTKILQALGDERLSKSALENRLKSRLVGWPVQQRENLLTRLVAAKSVYKLPPLKGNYGLYSARPADPREYLDKAFTELARKILRLAENSEPAGFTPERVFAVAEELWRSAFPQAVTAPSAPVIEKKEGEKEKDLNDAIIGRMLQRWPAAAGGALVSVTELRRELDAEIPQKEDFDRRILELAATEKIALHRHDYPANLEPTEREALVTDNHGNFYIGIALRA